MEGRMEFALFSLVAALMIQNESIKAKPARQPPHLGD
jgi:hypothetical protein